MVVTVQVTSIQYFRVKRGTSEKMFGDTAKRAVADIIGVLIRYLKLDQALMMPYIARDLPFSMAQLTLP